MNPARKANVKSCVSSFVSSVEALNLISKRSLRLLQVWLQEHSTHPALQTSGDRRPPPSHLTPLESGVINETIRVSFCSPHDSSSFDVSMCTAQPYTVTMQCMFWFSHGTFKVTPARCTKQRQHRQTVNVSGLKATART